MPNFGKELCYLATSYTGKGSLLGII